jgi:hypothetical protein
LRVLADILIRRRVDIGVDVDPAIKLKVFEHFETVIINQNLKGSLDQI